MSYREIHGFDDVFRTGEELYAQNEVDISSFRNYPQIFHFLMANGNMQQEDTISLNSAIRINPDIANQLIKKGPSYDTENIDSVECRHILILTWAITKLGLDWGRVVEFGAGYGNFLRLIDGIVSYTKWELIDYPYVLAIQRVFLKPYLNNKIKFTVTTEDDFKDLFIATHSLSEVGKEIFDNWLHLLNMARRVLYVQHTTMPDKNLLDYKQRRIRELFDVEDFLEYEGGASIIYLFKRKDVEDFN